jgi:pimeloyl-ACP methyl ester carboxylesterase
MPFARVDDIELYHEVHGEGPLLALVMGLGVDHRAWMPHVGALKDRFTCLIYDQRGVGRTRNPDGSTPMPPYSTERFADDLAGLLDQLGRGPAHVCGVSMGGTISMQLAVRRPDLVRSLGLHSTWHLADPFLRGVFELRIPILRRLGPAALQHYVGLWAWAPQFFADNAQVAPISQTGELISGSDTEDWSEAEVACYLGHLQAAIDHDCDETLASITAPTLVTVGDRDILTERRFADAMAAAIPGARLEVVPGGGHAYCFESPALFQQLVADFALAHEAADA